MGKGFGIAAVIVVVLSFFVPFVGILGTGLAMILAAVCVLACDRVFAIKFNGDLLAHGNTSPEIIPPVHFRSLVPLNPSEQFAHCRS